MQWTGTDRHHRRGQGWSWAAIGLLSCLALACSKPDPAGEPGAAASGTGARADTARAGEQELVVFAAASLRDAFEALGQGFRRRHGHVELVFNFAGSQELRTQIEHGAPAGVLAAADPAHVGALVEQGLARPAVLFARNRLVVVVPAGAARVKRFEDLPAAERIVIGVPDVPVGRYTREVLARADARWPGFAQRVMARVASQELNVRQVLAKISLGEGDAAIVYRTDAAVAAGRVSVVPIPDGLNVTAEYPIAALAAAPDPGLAAAWIAYLRSPEGQGVLARFGFEPPPELAAPSRAGNGQVSGQVSGHADREVNDGAP